METLFPHLTSAGTAPSSREVMATYRNLFAVRVAEGSLRPMVLPYHLYGMFTLLIYLLIPHTKNPYIYAARWPVLAAICAWQWKTLQDATSMSMATGFAVGLIAAWGVVWAFTWLVLNRPQWDAKRVQPRMKLVETKKAEHNGNANGGDSRTRGRINWLSQGGLDSWWERRQRWDCAVPTCHSEVCEEVEDPGEAFLEGWWVGLPVVFHLF